MGRGDLGDDARAVQVVPDLDQVGGLDVKVELLLMLAVGLSEQRREVELGLEEGEQPAQHEGLHHVLPHNARHLHVLQLDHDLGATVQPRSVDLVQFTEHTTVRMRVRSACVVRGVFRRRICMVRA